MINRLRIEHPLFDGSAAMLEPPKSVADTNGNDAGGEGNKAPAPLPGMQIDPDYELAPAPLDLPVPGGMKDYHYGLLSAEIRLYSKS